MSVKLEEQIFEKYPLLKKLETGAYKIVIDEYIVMLHAKSESNKVALLRDGLNLNIPNKFISDNRDEAIQFFMNVIDAVMENVAYIGVFGQQCRSSTGHFCNEIF